jgi:hypothetical protein
MSGNFVITLDVVDVSDADSHRLVQKFTIVQTAPGEFVISQQSGGSLFCYVHEIYGAIDELLNYIAADFITLMDTHATCV